MLKYLENVDKLNSVLNLLSDDTSKQIYFEAVKYRLTYWISRMEPALRPSYSNNVPKYPIPLLDGPAEMIKRSVKQVYFNSQYEIPGIVEVKKGDTVIDAGAFYGDSALYFESAVSPGGIVYAFEPNHKIANILNENIKNNNRLNITVIEKGLSDQSSFAKLSDNEEISMIVDDEKHNISDKYLEIKTTTIDEFVTERDIKHVNFIKMDIEGHENSAIKGSVHVLQKFQPKLAISIYHRYFDFYDLPLLINNINPNYKMYIRHATYNWSDTILFCI
ncbi:MAG: FkbM family methyltransferase [Deltaproteobacteria bacterium]|nr:FkbM family methyltransferase [Deltaproteobacteria bacterium]